MPHIIPRLKIFFYFIHEIKSLFWEGKFNAILAWHPDRLSRNAGDLGALIDMMDQKKIIEIRTSGQRFTNNPSEKFLFMILGSQAKLENDNKGVNVKRGLKVRAEMGLWPCVAPTGYENDKTPGRECYITVDPIRGPVMKQMFEKVGYEKWSGRRVYKWLKEDIKFVSRRGKSLNISTIYNLLKTPMYAGSFEYPRGSGNWYKGQHTPLITQELYDLVQEKMIEERNKGKKHYHDFIFTKLMICGHCGSGITAQEKTKIIKSTGIPKSYVYYSCTRHKDHFCKNPYLREDDLIDQLTVIIDKIDINELGARHIIDREIARHNKLRASVMGIKEKEKVDDIDIKAYAKYLLKEGTVYEKRELLENLRSKIVMKDKKISL